VKKVWEDCRLITTTIHVLNSANFACFCEKWIGTAVIGVLGTAAFTFPLPGRPDSAASELREPEFLLD
jgi:hypothetical protein